MSTLNCFVPCIVFFSLCVVGKLLGTDGNSGVPAPRPWRRSPCLAADAELLDELAVARLVLALEVVEELAAVLHLAKEAVARGVVLLVRLEVGGELLDLLREDRDLHFAGPRVAVVTLEFALDDGLVDVHFLLLFLDSANREA